MSAPTIVLPKNFVDAKNFIMSVVLPQELFGNLSFSSEAAAQAALIEIKKVFRMLSKLVHPDKNPKNFQQAELAFNKLKQLTDEAQAICNRMLGLKEPEKSPFPIVFKTKQNTYTLIRRMAEGSMCGIFTGFLTTKQGTQSSIVLKVPHSADDNDLMGQEAAALGIFKKKIKEIEKQPDGKKLTEMFMRRQQIFLETIKLSTPGTTRPKTANAFLQLPQLEQGWFTLEEIIKQHPKGVSTRIMNFIWNRALESLIFVHAAGLTHNALTPNHILIHAKEHRGNLIDWTASTAIADRKAPPYIDDKRYEGYFPEELLDPTGIPTPETDIYMLAWSMVYVLGGNPKKRIIPVTVEAPIRELLNKCLQPKRKHRPHTANDVYENLRKTTKSLFGPRKFVELEMRELT